MTVQSETEPIVVDSVIDVDERDEHPEDVENALPAWIEENRALWGEPVLLPEWDIDNESYRFKHGWKGSDLVHDRHAPVRITEYYVQYGAGEGLPVVSAPTTATPRKGGLGTMLTGVVHFTKRAESHAGYCHGGSMCSVMDDIIGWCAFFITGQCVPWSGYTVQVNTRLQKPIPVQTFLMIQATISHIDRRKVSIQAKLINPQQHDDKTGDPILHATAEGLVILNHGVL